MDNERPIIIKKIKKGGHGHHGGAWKVAYADFVTAMMAFFLLLWLINMTSPEQKRGIADYFAPASVSKTTSGSGGLLAGQSLADAGARMDGSSAVSMEVTEPKPSEQRDPQEEARDSASNDAPSEQVYEQELKDRGVAEAEERMFEQAAESLRQAMRDMPEIAELSKNLIIDQTPEGLRIQIVDQEGRPMFPPGAAEPYERTKTLLRAVGKITLQLPNRISISGHTDSAPFFRPDGYTNWDLSADRANQARRVLQEVGLDSERIYLVAGKAGSEPLYPDDPYMSANRRISIVLLREAPVLPPGHRL